MTAFWLMSGLTAALAALLVLGAARRAVDPSFVDDGARQLAELEALRARGLMDEAAFSAARAEAGRRLLRSQDDAPAGPGPGWSRVAVLGGLGLTAAVALGLYILTGSPGAPDQPYQKRVDVWAEDLENLDPPRLAAVARRVAAERPDDAEAQAFLGRAQLQAGDPIAAATAMRRALAINPDDANNWSRLGEALTQAQEGEVGPDAEAAFHEALRRDPDNRAARYFLGRLAISLDDGEQARLLWAPLLAPLAPTDPRRLSLEAELAMVTS